MFSSNGSREITMSNKCVNGEFVRKNYICSVCNFCSMYPASIRRHIRFKHNGNGRLINRKDDGGCSQQPQPHEQVTPRSPPGSSTSRSPPGISRSPPGSSTSHSPPGTSTSRSPPGTSVANFHSPPGTSVANSHSPPGTSVVNSPSPESVAADQSYGPPAAHHGSGLESPAAAAAANSHHGSDIGGSGGGRWRLDSGADESLAPLHQSTPRGSTVYSPFLGSTTPNNNSSSSSSSSNRKEVQVIRSGDAGRNDGDGDHHEVYDISLIEQFKLFISGPSRCGKTVWVTDFLFNMKDICKEVPEKVLYIYETWQPQYDDIQANRLVDFLIQDDSHLEEKIKGHITGKPLLIIFDDLISSSNLPFIANLFMVHGRHNRVSCIFISQIMFPNNISIRNISRNSNYLILFKNPRYNRDISVLAQQMTPGKLDLKMIYAAATADPFSYLFINVTQECKPAVKYLSHLFNEKHKVNAYVVN